MKGVRSILDQNAFRFDTQESTPTNLSRMVEKRLKTVGPTSVLFYQEPLHIVRGEGVWLYDDSGNRYLDVYNNVPSVGHCHPKVVDAVCRQMAELNIHTRYLHGAIHEYIERILDTMPSKLNRMVMTCTGSESNDMALRLARHWTKNHGVIVTEAAYHGNTSAVTEISPSSLKTSEPADHVFVIPISEMPQAPDEAKTWFLNKVREGIQTLNDRRYGCAALIVDTIFSSDGVIADPAGFLKPSVELIQSKESLFIADEVQPGFGRTGDNMWGFARHDVAPDIVTMGKPMGNGYPAAGIVANDHLFASFNEEVGYFNTFGGSTAAVAAGSAVLDVIEEENLIANSKEVGLYLKTRLTDLANEYEEVGAVRGAGLFVGLDFIDPTLSGAPDPAKASKVINSLRQNGVLIGAAGKYGNTLKIRPPLCFENSHADFFLNQMQRAIEETR